MTEDEMKRNSFEMNSFRNRNSLGRECLLTLASEIETRSFRKMWVFEGLDPDVEEALNCRAGSRAKKPTYGGVGVRLRKYKKFLCRTDTGYEDEPLRERPVQTPEGTPQGNRSLRRMFGNNNE